MPPAFRITGLSQWNRLSQRSRETYLIALENLNTSRVEHRPLAEVVRSDAQISMATQMRYIRSATRRDVFGRVVAKDADRLFHPMEIYGTGRRRVMRAVYGSGSASEIAGHQSALDRFLQTGDERHLLPFRGHRRAGVEFGTDPAYVEADAREGILDDLGPYVRATR
jgi:hypothetical protein